MISVFGEKFHLTQINIFYLFCLFIQKIMDLKWVPRIYNKLKFLSLTKPETMIVKTKAMHKKERIGVKLDVHYETIIELEKRKQ